MKEVRSHLGQGGSVFQRWAGIGRGPFCNAFVSYCLAKTGNGDLYCEGRKEINCPHSMNWCIDHLAGIPIYLAMEGDVTYMDWQPNGLPDHVGFVEERIDADKYHTIEGNTSGGIVARKVRTDDQEQLTFRLHYTPTAFSSTKKLEVDGLFGYNTIAVMQRWLGVDVDAILGQITVKALQKKLGVTADGLWGVKTTKALQKLIGATVDGLCGPDTVKAFQRYLNAHAFTATNTEVNIPATVPAKVVTDPLQPWFDAMETQYKWSKDQKYQWVTPTVKSSKSKGTCITFPAVALQRLGLIPSGTYFYFYPKTKKITGKAADIVKKGEKFSLSYPNKTVKELWKEGKIKKGDIVGYGNPNYHTMVFMGMKDGEPIYNTMGGGKRGLKVTYPYYAKRKVNMIVRLKAVK